MSTVVTVAANTCPDTARHAADRHHAAAADRRGTGRMAARITARRRRTLTAGATYVVPSPLAGEGQRAQRARVRVRLFARSAGLRPAPSSAFGTFSRKREKEGQTI